MSPRTHSPVKPFEKPIYVTRPILPDLEEYNKSLQEIWDSEWLTNGGRFHQQLERDLSDYLRSPYISLFNNGTIALITACQAFNLSGEVITTPFTFPATPHVLSWNGIQPVFVDIDPLTMNLDASKIEQYITNKTTGILGVHVFGEPCDVHGINDVADRYGLKVIYDGAHAFGVEIDDTPITSFGDATMLSFHATKLFNTAEGGALVVNDKPTKDRVDLLKNFGIKNEFQVMMPGINGKMSEIHASYGIAVLKIVDQHRAYRKKIRAIYCNMLSSELISLPREDFSYKKSEQYFAVRIKTPSDLARRGINLRDRVYDNLKSLNIFSRKYFYPLCSDYSCYRLLPSSNKALLPNAYQVAEEVLCLPYHSSLSEDDVVRISTAIMSYVGSPY